MENWSEKSDGQKLKYVAVRAVGGIVALVLVFGSFGIVDPGEMGVKVRLGKIGGTIEPGLYFKLPLMEKVVKMDVRTQSLVATKEMPMSAASNDLQDTRLAVVVNYHIEKTTVANIYQQYGDADKYYHTVVEPLITATVKATASQYTAAEQIQKRADMASKALLALQTAFEGKNVSIEKADITDVAFSDSFTQAIEAKVTAVQQAETAKNKLEQIKFEAQQTIETAKATAEAQRISSAALASQGGSDYVKLKWIEAWSQGGAQVPHYVTGNAGNSFLMNIGN